jgi:DNA-directed RNA polymerase
MATPAEIDEQIALEREQIRQGLKDLQRNTQQLEAKEYASAAIYGVASVQTLVPLVAEKINASRMRLYKGQAGSNLKELHQFLSDVSPEAAAAIAAKVTMDKLFSPKDASSQLQNVADAIGQALENECMMRFYEKNVPGLLHTLRENYWHRSMGTHQKVVVIRTLMNRMDVQHWKAWGRANRIRLGTWLLDCICSASGWFDKQMVRQGRKTPICIVPTKIFMDQKEQIMGTAELFSPCAWPMLIEPNDWSNDKPGGYLLNEVMRGHDMVRRGNPCRIQGEKPIAFLNQIQKVAYTLNPFTVKVAETLLEKGIDVGKFVPIVELPLPPKPHDIDTNKVSRKDYRRKAAEVMNINAQAYQRSCRTRMTMNAVKVFKDKDKFFIPFSFDYRGRCYPIPAFLTPQDTDFGKSLLSFYEAAEMTPGARDWLAFQCATTYGNGMDKATIDERHEWPNKNRDLIIRVATDPIGNLPDWEGADEPWCFLAACEEYYHCVVKCDRKYTSLPIAVDATCSGLQILAGLARDSSTAKLVNVLPGEVPQDAYRVIAEASKDKIPACIRTVWDRKCTKRTVMTVPYNAKPFSNRGYIREALKEKGVQIENEDLTKIVSAVRQAMDNVVPGPMKVMKWIESEVGEAIKRGATELTWETPSGFVVTQRLMKKVVEHIDLQLLGRVQLKVATGDSDEVDTTHHKNATAPNLIHSLDASLLHLSALSFRAPLALIHDSVLARAVDMDQLSFIVRQTYMHLFAEHDYLNDWAAQIGAQSEPPIIGDLEPERVIKSTYFFC